ncbi:MAG TPA: hypothetical protein VNG91_00745 [Terriglobia bacterium]|nr:hypothetical protein [Terriglobia bacterium]
MNQGSLLPPSLEDWLPEGHLTRFVAAEWNLICATHNLLKLFRSGWIPQSA